MHVMMHGLWDLCGNGTVGAGIGFGSVDAGPIVYNAIRTICDGQRAGTGCLLDDTRGFNVDEVVCTTSVGIYTIVVGISCYMADAGVDTV